MKAMLKRINDVLAGLPATVVGGVLLVFSFVCPRVGVELPVDPAWGTVVICGIPLLYLGIWRIIHNPGISKISSALLIDIAMVAAICIGDLFAAGEVAFIMALGALLEDATTNRAKKGLKKLAELAPATARRVGADGAEEEVLAADLREGDVVRVRPGETMPVDGTIVAGETSVDQSAMTGESLPVDKGPGDEVFCGTQNRFGSVDVRATKVGEASTLSRLVRMMEAAEGQKAPIARIADRAASWLVPLAAGIAVVAGLVTGDIVRAVTVLVVFCPCALVLATPTAVMAAIGQATKRGVVIKSGEALELLGKVNTVALDKTGTLTEGTLEVSDVVCAGATSEDELLALAAAAKARSEHPLGRAVVDAARARSLELATCEDFTMEGGRGVEATVAGQHVLCGSERYLAEKGVPLPEAAATALQALRAQGKATIVVAADGACVGVIALADVLRPEAPEACARLAKMGVRTVLLTGDNADAAAYFAERSGVSEVHAGLLPEEKVAEVERLREEGHVVCMVGDGVNDAPALALADVGVAMGAMGSDIAVEAADVALMGDEILNLAYLKRLGVACVNTIKFSITLSMCINFVAVTCSVLDILNPTTGALVHNAGSCLVVLIAALLYDRNLD